MFLSNAGQLHLVFLYEVQRVCACVCVRVCVCTHALCLHICSSGSHIGQVHVATLPEDRLQCVGCLWSILHPLS